MPDEDARLSLRAVPGIPQLRPVWSPGSRRVLCRFKASLEALPGTRHASPPRPVKQHHAGRTTHPKRTPVSSSNDLRIVSANFEEVLSAYLRRLFAQGWQGTSPVWRPSHRVLRLWPLAVIWG